MSRMRLFAKSSLLLLPFVCVGAGFFSNPERVATLTMRGVPWETAEIGAVWSDNFNRALLGSNWIAIGGANITVVSNQLRFSETNANFGRQVYYQPWLTCSDSWTIRWSQRFEALTSSGYGVGVGIKNFQEYGGTNRGYNVILYGTGIHMGCVEILRGEVNAQVYLTNGSPMTLNAGDIVDCSFTRSGWRFTATATNRANLQVSTCSFLCLMSAGNDRPTISRMCFYPLGGNVLVDDLSFSINRRTPARFIVVGGSTSDGYVASSEVKRYNAVVQSNFIETVCNDSSSYNVTANSVSVLPEILAHHPTTALLLIGGNDLLFNVPTASWKSNYAYLVSQLQSAGVTVKHALPSPRNPTDLTPLKTWISTNYSSASIIDLWTPMATNVNKLQTNYDSGDGIHPNDAGHLLMGLIIRTNLP